MTDRNPTLQELAQIERFSTEIAEILDDTILLTDDSIIEDLCTEYVLKIKRFSFLAK